MTYDFAPLAPDAVRALSVSTGVSFHGRSFDTWLCCTARGDSDQVLGVLVMEPWTWFDWYLSVAILDRRCITRKIMRALFTTAFDKCGAVRITAEVDPDNRRALKQMKQFGFVYEGYKRFGIEGVRDGLLFGMLRGDCPWLPGYDGGTIIPQPTTEVTHGFHA